MSWVVISTVEIGWDLFCYSNCNFFNIGNKEEIFLKIYMHYKFKQYNFIK